LAFNARTQLEFFFAIPFVCLFALQEDRLHSGKAKKKELFLCHSLRLHYLCSELQAGICREDK